MSEQIRVDKWLWAARFFKTRGLASDAVKGGKVHIDKQKAKPSKILKVGNVLDIRKGDASWEVEVISISGKRQNAKIAEALYKETKQSKDRRLKNSELRKLAGGLVQNRSNRPTKKDRRDIEKFSNKRNFEG